MKNTFAVTIGFLVTGALLSVSRAQSIPLPEFTREVADQLVVSSEAVDPPLMVVTFRDLGQLRLQAQFPLSVRARCSIGLRYLARGMPSVMDQLLAIVTRQPEITPAQAAAAVRLETLYRELPCEGALARLLRSGAEMSVRLRDPGEPREVIYVDTDRVRVEMVSAGLRAVVEFPETLDEPIARWALDLLDALNTFIAGEAGPK